MKWLLIFLLIALPVSAADKPPRFTQYYACLAIIQGMYDESVNGVGVWNKQINDLYEYAEQLYSKEEQTEGHEIFVYGLSEFGNLSQEFKDEMSVKCDKVFRRAGK